MLSIPVSVLNRKFVAASAVRFSSINCRRAVSTQDVFFTGNGFQMERIYALAIAAKMVNFFTSWNFPEIQFVRKSMSEESVVVIAEAAVLLFF